MPIQFACPSCARQYSVKDELAGKGAKCGQCGHKMTIPQASTQESTTSAPVAKKSAPVKAPPPKTSPAKSIATSVPKPAPAVEPGVSSWLDEELEESRAEIKAKPQPPPTAANCPSCNSPLAAGAVLCVKCGYDTRTRGRRVVEHGEQEDEEPKRSKLGTAASLLRGTIFSFLGAMLGAVAWAVLAYFTLHEFWFMAWALGGLAGIGMALGHEDDDGTIAGIIAAFMSLVGIVAAKVCIIVIFIAAFVSSAVNELEIADEAGGAVEFQRSALAMAMAMKDLEAQGITMADVDKNQFEAAVKKAKQEVAQLPAEEIEARLESLAAEHGLEGELEEVGDEAAEPGDAVQVADRKPEDDVESSEGHEEEVTFGSLLGELFGPVDGIFILLAFFTAYKVGSGEMGD
jgi:transcription elongation factor Elf1